MLNLFLKLFMDDNIYRDLNHLYLTFSIRSQVSDQNLFCTITENVDMFLCSYVK